MFTNAEIINKIARLAQRSGDSDYLVTIQDFVNYAQDIAFRAYDYYAELEDKYLFNTVNGTESYYMPSSFDKPLRIFDMTNNRKLNIWTEEQYVESNISSVAAATTGVPNVARLFGISAVNVAISSSGDTFKAKSSSSSDTGAIIVRIEGYIDAGLTVIDYESITLNSSSPTTFATATTPKTFYKITHISKSADTTGYITIANAAGTTYAIISSTERASRYPVLNLGLIPNSSNSMRILFKRRVQKLTNDNDYPFIDADEFFINYGWAYSLSQSKETVERAQQIFSKADGILKEVIRNQQTRLGEDFQHKMRTTTTQAHRV